MLLHNNREPYINYINIFLRFRLLYTTHSFQRNTQSTAQVRSLWEFHASIMRNFRLHFQKKLVIRSAQGMIFYRGLIALVALLLLVVVVVVMISNSKIVAVVIEKEATHDGLTTIATRKRVSICF